MGNGVQFIDIIFFALVAAFLVLQLRRVLGRRDGHQGGRPDPFTPQQKREQSENTVVQLPGRSDESSESSEDESFLADADADADQDTTLSAGLVRIAETDTDFRPEEFLSGARIAFDLILGAFIAGDDKALKPLVSSEVFGNFARAISDRKKAGETMEDSLVGIKSADLMEAYMEGAIANVTIKFVSEQVNVMRDENGDVVSGNPNLVNEVTDFWTFARDTQSRDPNWSLVATHSSD